MRMLTFDGLSTHLVARGTWHEFRFPADGLHHRGGPLRSRDRGALAVRRHRFPYFRIADAALAFSDAKIHASEIGSLRTQPARPGRPSQSGAILPRERPAIFRIRRSGCARG